jgi:anti-sigma B factor antagonist
MRFSLVSVGDDLTRIRCEGEITMNDLAQSRDPVEDLLGPAIFRQTALLDLGATSYIDSSGISYLLGVNKRFKQVNGRLVLHSAPPSVNQVFKLLKIHSVMQIVADEAEARRLVQGAPA